MPHLAAECQLIDKKGQYHQHTFLSCRFQIRECYIESIPRICILEQQQPQIVVHLEFDTSYIWKMQNYLIFTIDYLVKFSNLFFLLFPVGRSAITKQKTANVIKSPIKTYPTSLGVQLNSTNGMSNNGRKMRSCIRIGMS